MKVRTKIRRSIKAISPVISVLLMIAIAVAAAIIAYAWIMGYLGGTQTKAQKAIQIQSIAANKNPGNPDDKWLIVYVQNVGIGAVKFDPDACVYVKDVLKTCTVDDADLTVVEGQTVKMLVDYTVVFDERIKIKVVTLDGMFTEFTGTIKGEAAGGPTPPPTYQVTFATSGGGGGSSTTPSGTQTYSAGASVAITAMPGSGYQFVSWSAAPGITFDSATSASTNAHINGAGTITATFSAAPPANVPPTAAFTFSPLNPVTGQIVQFTDGSSDSDGSVVAWAWTFGDGGTSLARNPTHVYTSVGPFTVGLTVTDNDGATDHVDHSVPVGSPIQYALTMYTVGQGTVNPGNGTYSSGVIVNIEAINAPGWTFTGWSVPPGGTANTTITMDGPKTVTATFTQDQYSVTLTTVGSGSASKTPDQPTYTYGAIVNLLATETTPGWTFSGWSSSTPNIVIANPSLASTTATINGAGTITVTFTQNQYTITFAHTGLDSTATGTVVTVNGSAKTFNDLSFILPVNFGDVVTYSYETTISGGSGKQFVSTGVTGPVSPITVSGSITVTGNYKTQFYLTMSANFGTTSPVSGWYDAGSVVNIEAYSPSVVAGEQYVWNGWTGTGTISYTGMTNQTSVTMNSAITETASWTHQYQLTMVTNFGTTIPAVGSTWYNAGATVTISATAPSAGAGERYVWNGWTGTGTGSYTGTDNPAINAVTMNGPITETASWTLQYQVTFAASPIAGGSTTPSTPTWYNAGSSGNAISASNNPGYTFSSWSADPPSSITFAGPSASTTITVNGAGTITATFTQNQYLVSFRQNGAGAAPTVDYQIDSGSVVTQAVPFDVPVYHGSQISYTYQATVSGGSGTQYVLTSVDLPSPQTVTSPLTITGNYKTQYYLTVSSAYGTPGGAGWYDSGATAYATVTPLTVAGPAGTQYVFTQWSGDASGTTSPSDSITMNGPKTATANWKTQYYLTVSSAYDSSTGQGWYDSGATAGSSVSSPVSGGDGIQYVATGYTGTGSAPTGSGTSVSFTITAPSSITWNWQTQYRLTMATNFGSTSPAVGTSWVNAGSPVTIYAVMTNGTNERYLWAGWTGTGTGSYTGMGNNSALVTMNAPITETASWTHQYQVSFAISPVGAGSTTPSTSTWYDAGSSGNPISATANPSYVFASWSANPPSSITFAAPLSSSTTMTVNGAGTVTANFNGPKLVFIPATGQSLAVGTVSSSIRVQRQDANGNPVTSGGAITVNLATTSNGGGFYDTAGLSNIITSIQIANGQSSSVSFYYVDYAHGSPTLTGSYAGLSSATTTFTITGMNEPVYSTSLNPTSVPLGSPVTFTYRITLLNTTEVDGSYANITIPGFTGISVSSVTMNGVSGRWSSAVQGNVITLTSNSLSYDLEVAGDYVQVVFTATPQSTGTYTFTSSVWGHLSDSGGQSHTLGPGTSTGDPSVTVYTVGPLDHFTFNTISTPQTAGTAFSITITAKDASGNTVTSYTGTNTLTVSSGTISPTSTTAFTAGVWTGQVTLFTSGSGITIGTSGATKTGTSNGITVNTGSGAFGNTHQGSGTNTLENTIRGSLFTSPAYSTTAQSITAYIQVSSTHTVKAAIYTSTGTLIASTQEVSVTTSNDGWVTFNFASGSKPTLTASTDYILVVWSNSVYGSADLYGDGSSGQSRYVDQPYGNWPSSVTFTASTTNWSIYCTYSIP